MLLALLRAPLLAALAVALNLLSVGAAIGVVTLACKHPAGYPLGGHPLHRHGRGGGDLRRHLRPLDRLCRLPAGPHARELSARAATTPPRSRFGLEKTAGVITGAAAIMAAVFASFADRAGRHGQPDGPRPHRRDPARRDRRSHRPAAGADAADRRARLAHARLARADPACPARAAPRGRRGGG